MCEKLQELAAVLLEVETNAVWMGYWVDLSTKENISYICTSLFTPIYIPLELDHTIVLQKVYEVISLRLTEVNLFSIICIYIL